MDVCFSLLLSFVAAVFPMVAYMAFIWWMDRYEREPLWLVASVFFWGAMGGIVLGCLGTKLLDLPTSLVLDSKARSALQTVLWAPISEELAKGVILVLVFWNRQFDNLTDGIVYGSATGLGFAMTENFLYFIQVWQQHEPAGWLLNVVIRTGFSGVTHCIASAAFGATLGVAKFDARGLGRVALPCGGLALAMAVHALWNTLVLATRSGGGAYLLLAMGATAGEVVLLMVLLQVSLLRESRMIRVELAEESKGGNIPAAHLGVLPFYFRRNRPGWLPASVDRRRYVELATRLAFRRAQARSCFEGRRKALEEEIRSLRLQLHHLLGALLPPLEPTPGPPAVPPGEPPMADLVP
ncbi:MAG: PrsW family intramembrane metalloprotease [Planctomycetes bacterium]|nr:PrsW family intramembrane metalloprotease [Planctomycetota bacterium]